MPAKLIVRVFPDDRVEVKVEGLTARDEGRPPQQKLCKKVTARLERDLGEMVQCVYSGDTDGAEVEIINQDQMKLGG